MSRADPIEELIQEHGLILALLDGLERLAGDLTRAACDVPRWRRALDLLQRLSCVSHHRKEELLLFPALERAGLAGGSGPLASLRREHESERGALREVDRALAAVSAGQVAARAELQRAALELASLVRQHVAMADQVVYPLARRLVPPAELEALGAACRALDLEQHGPGGWERMRREVARACERPAAA